MTMAARPAVIHRAAAPASAAEAADFAVAAAVAGIIANRNFNLLASVIRF
jgi:hypothetical protein